MLTILAIKISAVAAATGTPMLVEQQPAHAAPVGFAVSPLTEECAAPRAFAFHDDSAIAHVTTRSRDAVEPLPPQTGQREVFIPSPGTIALLGVGILAMRRKRND